MSGRGPYKCVSTNDTGDEVASWEAKTLREAKLSCGSAVKGEGLAMSATAEDRDGRTVVERRRRVEPPPHPYGGYAHYGCQCANCKRLIGT
jgi:hypothetical protein